MKNLLLGVLAITIGNVLNAQATASLNDLSKHVGDSVKVEGRVFSTRYLPDSKNAPTLLNIGAAYPNQLLTVVIYGEDRKNFKKPPEEFYKDKLVVVSGKVEMFRDKPQIVVKDGNGIEALLPVESKKE